MKILLAVDGSDYTKRMLSYLETHDKLLGHDNDFTALTVEGQLPPRARGVLNKDVREQYHSEEAEKVLAPVLEFLKRYGGSSAQGHYEVGQPGETIAHYALQGNFDLIVMGSHGHGRLVNLMLGSVTSAVLAHCRVPVLLIR